LTSIDPGDASRRLDVNSCAADYEKRLRERLVQASVQILPLPATDHMAMLNRDLERRRPFREGKGYRDALLWESVIALAADTGPRVALVTENKKDFARDEQLHPDLAADLAAIDLPPDRVLLLPSLPDAFERLLKNSLRDAPEVRKALESKEGYRGFRLVDWLKTEAAKVLPAVPAHDDEPLVMGLRVGDITEVQNATVGDVRLTVAGEVIVDATADVRARLTPEMEELEGAPTTNERLLVMLGRVAHMLLPRRLKMVFTLAIDSDGKVISADCVRLIRGDHS
jgi:hypothetical protein